MIAEDCVFCRIVSGMIPSEKIYEDEHVFAFLDINPVNTGHTLVIPKSHFGNIHTINKEEYAHVMEAVRVLSTTIEHAVHAEGINVMIVGEEVFHFHVHLIPRYVGDGLHHWQGEKESSEKISTIGKTIRAALF